MNKKTVDKEVVEYNFEQIENKWIATWDKNQTYKVGIDKTKPKFYCLDTWPYPSAGGVHIGYVKSFAGMDVVARYKRMKGFNVLYPMGWDTLGLPAENYAIKENRHPREITDESIKNFRKQFKSFALSYDWSKEINTADPSYYKWTQWVFLIMFKLGLAYRKKSSVNWCPNDKTVLANEQVVDGKCERCGADVTKRELMQWFFKVTDYADRLYEDCSKLNWDEKYLNVHKQWIGKKVEDGKTSFHIRDWSIARQRYWGPPIPIIYCDKCGIVPVPEADLPVVLPYKVDFIPTGESPLAKVDEFVNTTCPNCGAKAKREVDILDTFVSSAWYQFRFMDINNDKEIVSKEAIDYWQNIDNYEGTIEHLTAHLIYARFVTKVLFDKGHIPVDEPFPKYTPVGMLVDKSGTKFSKRLGNAPDSNELIHKYGGDLLRLSCFFITSFDDVSRWGEQDVIGVKKFRDKIWRIFNEKVSYENQEIPLIWSKKVAQLIIDVQDGIEAMKYNIALSKMMVFISEIGNYDGMVNKDVWTTFTKLLAPFAPFMAEEMWSQMGNINSIHTSSWPTYDPEIIKESKLNITVQINGKFRGIVEAEIGSKESQIEKMVINLERLKSYIPKKYKILFIKDRVINFISTIS